MISFLKTYKHVALGLVFTILIIYVSDRLKLVFIDKNEILANSMIFIFMWSLFTLIIYKAPELIANKTTTLKLLALLVLLIITFVIDHNMRIPDNPIVIILMVVLGILTLLLLAPKILHRYKFPITVFYVLTLGYFLYRRVIMNDMSTYYQQQKEVLILLMLPFFIVLFLWAYHQMRRFNDFKIEKGKAELALLKSQINPHFLFNTLNNLYGLIVEKSDEAPKVVLKLSDMLRYTIYEGKEDLVFLKNEVTYLENYIALHKIRYQKNVDIIFNHNIKKDLKIAPLLFIILLENAFKHGVEQLTKDAYIHIDLKNSGDIITFQIANNFELKKNHTNNGIGLDNLNQRLLLIYPKKHSLKIDKENTVYKTTLKIDTK